ncbi:hypothetical protein Tco_0158852 [Tanacetum coccineum]
MNGGKEPLDTPAAGGSSSGLHACLRCPAPESGKSKRKRLVKQSDTLLPRHMRKDHQPWLPSTVGKTLAGTSIRLSLSVYLLTMPVSAEVHVVNCMAARNSAWRRFARLNVVRAKGFEVAEEKELEIPPDLNLMRRMRREERRTREKDTDISLLNSSFPFISSLRLNDPRPACAEAGMLRLPPDLLRGIAYF